MNTQRITFLLFVLFVTSCGGKGTTSEIFSTDEGAVQGYDVVAYFKEQSAVKGESQFEYEWKDVNWYFSSAENKADFMANPEKFVPQYGGYCAYGTSKGKKAPTEPDAWAIVDGKLYLNFNKLVQEKWKQDQSRLIKKADEEWLKIRGSEFLK